MGLERTDLKRGVTLIGKEDYLSGFILYGLNRNAMFMCVSLKAKCGTKIGKQSWLCIDLNEQ